MKDNNKINITTWNVNSVRRRLNSIDKFLKEYSPDILMLQETKVRNDLFPFQFFRDFGYSFIHHEGETTGYNGVAIIAKEDLPIAPKISFIKDARHLAVKIRKDIDLHNFYIPAGGDIPDVSKNIKFKEKLKLLDKLTAWFKSNKSKNDKVIIAGDLNIAPLKNDVWSHKQLLNIVSHTPIEVEKLLNLYKSIGFKNSVRKFAPASEKLYSWWSYRARDWEKSDRGRRLDHIWSSSNLDEKVMAANIIKSTRNHDLPSDHVPVSIDINL
jgi:exodeoxyribonuclease-3